MDVTVVVADESTVYGPRSEPVGPLRLLGVIVRLGGGGVSIGPWLITLSAIAATSL